ncbi:outer membrane protein assembly factor BamE [Rhodocyclus tenuis]|uniref:Outer membrane protein assembly factor BamE n=1 Tax=Rhodocyclus tenuis TaxID=1066 RepID=A0A840GI49_RHOTE|nr:outer membrane protein assembly factor BamE [Rhodocyclus tenuis]MBB4248152.1 outer membrane protein assembly factor BamE [Rhodocyclus tenuis]
MKSKRILAAALLLVAISGCSSVPKLVTEYRIDVQQGNVLTQEMVAQLKPGQTREQVRFILGTPMLIDMFHADRWDYVYRLRKGATDTVETRRFTVFFDADGRLFRVAGDVAAASAGDAGAEPEVRSRLIDLGSVPEGTAAPATEQRGFFGRMLETVGF